MEPELKPCHHCGSTDLSINPNYYYTYEKGVLYGYDIRCSCGVIFSLQHRYNTEEEAREAIIDFWNTRFIERKTPDE